MGKYLFFGLSAVILPILVAACVTASILDWVNIQAIACPYISLCTRPNTSAVLSFHSTSTVHCCHECSCASECQEQGNCCPDLSNNLYNNFSYLDDRERSDTPVVKKENQNCVKTQYGSISQDYGYTMVQTCPDNYTDVVIKRRCEEDFDYKMNPIYLNIPVSDDKTDTAFKNIYCKICNTENNESLSFWVWEVWLYVKNGFILNDLPTASDPLDAAKLMLQSPVIPCSIVFKPKSVSNEENETNKCLVRTLIDTCDPKYAGSNIESTCKAYHWPISRMTKRKRDIYKNYACMVCNDKTFEEYCRDWNRESISMLSLTTVREKLKQILEQTQHRKNYTELPKSGQIIKMKFTTGNECMEGFAYDNLNGACRRVFCPNFFFINEGKCIPSIISSKGLVYRIRFQILLPYTLKGESTIDVEPSIQAGLERLFQQRNIRVSYDVSVLSTTETAKTITEDSMYFGVLTVRETEVNYKQLLESINLFLLQKRKFEIYLRTKFRKKRINLGITFAPLIALRSKAYLLNASVSKRRVLFNVKGSIPFILKPFTTDIDVTKVSLCYMVTLNETEYEWVAPGKFILRVFSTNQVLYGLSFRITNDVVSVCLNDAFNNSSDKYSYIMNVTGSREAFYKWPQHSRDEDLSDTKGERKETVTKRKKPPETNINTEPEGDVSKSLAAVIGIVVITLLVIMLRWLVKVWRKNILKRSEIPNENIDMSNLEHVSRTENETESCNKTRGVE